MRLEESCEWRGLSADNQRAISAIHDADNKVARLRDFLADYKDIAGSCGIDLSKDQVFDKAQQLIVMYLARKELDRQQHLLCVEKLAEFETRFRAPKAH